jgi:hypothetical protein
MGGYDFTLAIFLSILVIAPEVIVLLSHIIELVTRRRHMQARKIIVAVITSLSVATISAAFKSYVDVERLKTKQEMLFDIVKETRDDVKDIRTHLLED